MGAALCFDDFPQLGHHRIMRHRRTLIVKRGLNLLPEPAIDSRGLFSRRKLGLDR